MMDSNLNQYLNEYNKSVSFNNLKLISDMDNVLVNIDLPAYYIIKKLSKTNKYYFLNQYFNLNFTDEEIINRDVYDVFEFILKDKNNSNKKELKEFFLNSTFARNNFYNDLKPTKYCQGLVNLVNSNAVEKLIILSVCLDGTNETKIKWIKNVFGEKVFNEKIDFLEVPYNEKKSTILNKYYKDLKWNSYAEDVLYNIIDVVKNCNGELNEVIIPSYGYNKIDTDFVKFANEYMINLEIIKSPL